MGWTMNLTGANGGAYVAADRPFAGARIAWTSDGPGAIEVDIPDKHMVDAWQPGTHWVVAELDGVPKWAGYLTNLRQSGPPGAIVWTASGLGLASRLDMRIIRHQFVVDDVVSDHVAVILADLQAQLNGNMGFSMGTVTGTTVNRLRSYCFGVVAGEAIRELASIKRGFDWEVDATGNINIWNNTRGTNTGQNLAIEDTSRWELEVDTADLVTTVGAIGERADPFGPPRATSHSALGDTYGRREVPLDVNTADRDELFDAGAALLEQQAGARIHLQTGWWATKAPWSFGTVWLEDKVSVDLPTVAGGPHTMRCVDVTVTIDPTPEEVWFVEHTFQALVEDISETTEEEEES